MITHNSLKTRLSTGEKLNGCWINLFNPIASEIVAMSGYDIALIDLEHGAGSYTEAISMMQAVSKYSCAPVIRASSSDIVDIKRTLDIGPEGIMIPNVQSAEGAERVVEACRYGPRGNRGAAVRIIRASGYGQDMPGYAQFMEKEFLLIAQIECKQAVDEIDRITAVEGIDMFFIGPSDLSASYGEMDNFEAPGFNDAYKKIEESVLTSGKFLGTIPIAGRDPEHLFNHGHQLVIAGSDIILLQLAADENVAYLRKIADK